MPQKFTFECQKCGKCCQSMTVEGRTYNYIEITAEEVLYIAEHLQTSLAEVIAKYVTMVGINRFKAKLIGDRCIFLTGDNKCSIQSVKPRKCAAWPYWDSFTNDPNMRDRDELKRCKGIKLID